MLKNKCSCGKRIYTNHTKCSRCRKNKGIRKPKEYMDRNEGLAPYQRVNEGKSYEDYVKEDKKINPSHHTVKHSFYY